MVGGAPRPPRTSPTCKQWARSRTGAVGERAHCWANLVTGSEIGDRRRSGPRRPRPRRPGPAAGPRRHHATSRSTAARGPSNSASTRTVGRGCGPSRPRPRPAPDRDTSRGTRPPARVRSPRHEPGSRSAPRHSDHSDLTCLAVERRPIGVPGALHDVTATRARLSLTVVHLVMVLVAHRAGRTGRRNPRRRATSRGTSPRPAASRRSRGTGGGSPVARVSR